MLHSRRSMLPLLVSLPLSACSALGGLLPVIGEVIKNIHRMEVVLNEIDAVVNDYFSASPDQEAQKKYAQSMGAARLALTAVLKASEGAEAAQREDVDLAWAKFQEAYTALLGALSNMGFRVQVEGEDSLLSTGEEGRPTLTVPRPEDVTMELDG